MSKVTKMQDLVTQVLLQHRSC